MSADQAGILAEVSEMLRGISDSLLPGEEITRDTTLLDDLELQSIGLARLAGRLQAKYGAAVNLVPFFTDRDAPLSSLGVGELVDHIASVISPGPEAGHGAAGAGLGIGPAAVGEMEQLVTQLAQRVVGRLPRPGRTFAEDGYTRLDILRVIGALEAGFGRLSETLLFDHPTAAELARYLGRHYGPVRAAHVLRTISAGGTRPQPPGADGAEGGVPAIGGMLGSFLLTDDGHRARNDNAAVLSEQAPGTERILLQLPAGQVEVFVAGDGPALIMMHPINVGAGVFARQFATLAAQYRLVCVHNPGVGATTWDGDLTLGGLAELHRTILAELAVPPPFHLMGSSFGGLVAQEFAWLYPAECASLVLVCSPYRIGGTPGARRPLPVTVAEEFDLISIGQGGEPHAAAGGLAELEELLLRCESMDTRMGLSYLSSFARTRPTLYGQLPGIVTPTLILHGRHDTVVPDKDAHLLYGAIPDARRAELGQAGHFPCLTHPAAVGRVVGPFLTAHPGPVPAAAPAAARGRPVAGPVAGRPPAGAGGWDLEQAPPSPAHLASTGLLSGPGHLERCIIISSGRCGSTMLSNLISDEPDTLSVYEVLTSLRRHLLLMPATDIPAAEFWQLMSDPGVQGAASARIGSVPEEACYPATGRWANDPRGIPPILYCTLPRMSADPDHLFDVLADQVRQFRAQPVTQHLRMLLDLLATMAGRRRWVERSGGSSAVAEPLLAALPEMKVVYLTRNIEDTARSMSQHSTFQFAAARYEFQIRYGTDPYSSWANPDRLPDPAELPEEMRRLLPDQVTMAALAELGRDTGRFEAMCAHMMGSAEQALDDLKPQHLHRMHYEDVLANPVDALTELGEFLGFADPSGWAGVTASRVRQRRASSAQPA